VKTKKRRKPKPLLQKLLLKLPQPKLKLLLKEQ
jgi:hypothetical protein